MSEPNPEYSQLDNADFRHSPDVLADLRRLKSQIGKESKGVDGTISGKALSAQYIKVYLPGKSFKVASILNSIMDDGNLTVGRYEKAVIELQFYYGLRISEVLQVRHSDITGLGQILIKGLKNSNGRIVYPVLYKDFWLRLKANKSSIPENYNRFYFYRLYKKLGLSVVMGDNKNNSVTHLLRYTYMINLMKNGISLDNLQQSIGHKSIKSTLHYVNKIRSK